MTEELLVFRGSLIVTAVIRTYRPGEEKYVADLHERLYAEEYGWGPAFVTYAKEIALDFPNRPASGREGLWIAEVGGEPTGSVMLCETEDPSVGQLRLFAVEKSRRRQGIGRALMEALLAKAEEVGYETLILWTAGPLEAAIRQYERFGFWIMETVENCTWRPDGEPVFEIKMEKTLTT